MLKAQEGPKGHGFAGAGCGQSLCGRGCPLVNKKCVVVPMEPEVGREEGETSGHDRFFPRFPTSFPSISFWSGTPRDWRILNITQQRRWLSRFYVMFINLTDNIENLETYSMWISIFTHAQGFENIRSGPDFDIPATH